jgi:hypothetical protein
VTSTPPSAAIQEQEPVRTRAHGPVLWSVIALSLVAYVACSSVLGLILLILASIPTHTDGAAHIGPLATFLVAWSTSVVADAVFVIGSIAGAVAGVIVARRSGVGSIAVAAVAAWLTYTIAAALILGPVGMPGEGGPPAPGADDSFRGILIFVAPLIGIVGLVFAAVTPSIARSYLFTSPRSGDATLISPPLDS